MKIAIVTERFDPRHGGAAHLVAQEARAFRRRGHEVTVVAAFADRLCGQDLEVCAMSAHGRYRGRAIRRFVSFVADVLARGAFDASLSTTSFVSATVCQPRRGTVQESLARRLAARRSA